MYKSEKKVFDIRERTFKFGVEIINVVNSLSKTTAGFAVGNQIIRSGTSVGANVEEAQNSSSRKEFIHGLTIALKEARETEYWLKIIKETGLTSLNLERILVEIIEIIKILTTIVKKSKINSKL